MRTFVAIPLTEEVHQELAKLQDSLRKSGCDIKWANPANIHLTLKFLGEIDDKQTEDIKASLAQALTGHNSFWIHIAGIGAFPRLSYPKIIWVGIDKGSKECIALARSIEEAVEKLELRKEKRPFSPHLTLGRIRTLNKKPQLISHIEKEKDFASQHKVSVNKIILFQSTLTPKGPIYTTLKEFSLA